MSETRDEGREARDATPAVILREPDPEHSEGDATEGSLSSQGSSLSRRRALQIIGSVPMAAALGVQQQQQPATPHVTPNTPAQPPEPAKIVQRSPAFFNAHEWATVRVLVDYVIPRDERSGSATDAKVPEYMDFLLSQKDASLSNQTAMRGGLAWLDTESRKRFGKTFVRAGDAQRREILDDIAWPRKARREMSQGVAFFNRFRDMTASGFFSSSIGWKDLQYIGNTFVPQWNGCPQPALDKLGVSYDLMSTRVAPQERSK
jgi:gluconate 2-dehydrogenase gamma chain